MSVVQSLKQVGSLHSFVCCDKINSPTCSVCVLAYAEQGNFCFSFFTDIFDDQSRLLSAFLECQSRRYAESFIIADIMLPKVGRHYKSRVTGKRLEMGTNILGQWRLEWKIRQRTLVSS